jgi:tripartite motif-containing protein 71
MQVQKYSPSGRLLAQWGTYGHTRGQFFSADGVAVDQHDRVYVTDGSGGRLEKFSATGKVLAVYGNLDTADGVAVDAQGTIYVTCDFINSVYKLSPTGGELARWG